MREHEQIVGILECEVEACRIVNVAILDFMDLLICFIVFCNLWDIFYYIIVLLFLD